MARLQSAAKCHAAACTSEGLGHPLIVRHMGHDSNFSIYCDGHIINCSNSIVETFDLCFKLLWVFDLKYPCGLVTFFKLFEQKVFKCGSGKPTPSVNEVARLIGIA